MKPPTSAQSAERSSRASRRRPTRNRHNLLPMKNQMKKNQMKNHPIVVGPKVLLVGQADRLGRLVDHPVDQAGHLGGLAGLPVDQADHLEGAEDGEPRKAWIEPGKGWIEPRKAPRQPKSEHSKQNAEHRKDKRVVGNAVIHECLEGVFSDTSRCSGGTALLPLHALSGVSGVVFIHSAAEKRSSRKLKAQTGKDRSLNEVAAPNLKNQASDAWFLLLPEDPPPLGH
jgi:hypothetical protein